MLTTFRERDKDDRISWNGKKRAGQVSRIQYIKNNDIGRQTSASLYCHSAKLALNSFLT